MLMYRRTMRYVHVYESIPIKLTSAFFFCHSLFFRNNKKENGGNIRARGAIYFTRKNTYIKIRGKTKK